MDDNSLAYSVNISTLLLDRPFDERPAAAAAAGFRWIEAWWPFEEAVPASAQVDGFVRIVEDAGVRLGGLSLAIRDNSAEVDGVLTLDGPTPILVDNAAIGAELGARLGCRVFNRRWSMRTDGIDPQAQDDRAVQTFAKVAHAVAPAGGTLVVEAVSQVERYPLKRTADALAMLDRVLLETDAANVAMMADLYHLHCSGDDVDGVIQSDRHRFAHVQIADSPGRGQPGSGSLPIARWLAALERGGYRGTVGMEYLANDDPDPFAWVSRERRGVEGPDGADGSAADA
jgi:hydroxypyruvate isomerase